MTTKTPEGRFEDRLLSELVEVVERKKAPTEGPATKRRQRRLSLVAAIAALGLAAAALAIVSLLDSPRSGLAQAAIIKHASAALQQPERILYVQAVAYGDGVLCLGGEAPARCIGRKPTGDAELSTNPANDPVSYTYQEWIGAKEGQQHTIYETGDETTNSGETERVYDPGNDTLTTTSEITTVFSPSSVTSNGSVPDVESLSISDIESLYRLAEAGNEEVQLVGQTTIAGESTYELNIAAQPSALSLQLYLNAQTFLPVRAVVLSPSTPVGPHVSVTSFTAKSLPATQANEGLLQMPAHPGATQVQMTKAQLSAAAKATEPSLVK